MKRKTKKEIEAVLKLDGPTRFRYFVKRIVDAEKIWSLWSDGWALMENDNGAQVFPLWPSPEFADICRLNEWSVCQVREITLSDFQSEVMSNAAAQGLVFGVFPTPEGRGVVVSPSDMASAIEQELLNYE